LEAVIEKVPAHDGEARGWRARVFALAVLGRRDQAMAELAGMENEKDKLTLAYVRAQVEVLAGNVDAAVAQWANEVRFGMVDVATLEQEPTNLELTRQPLVQQLMVAFKTPADRPERSVGLARFYTLAANPPPARDELAKTVAQFFAEAARK